MAKLCQADVEFGKGLKVPDVCQRMGVSEQTYYRWRTKYGGMDPQMARQLRDREKQNARLKKLVADRALDIQILSGGGTPKLVSPERRRRTVREMGRRLEHDTVSERQTCKVLRQARSTQRYHPRRITGPPPTGGSPPAPVPFSG